MTTSVVRRGSTTDFSIRSGVTEVQEAGATVTASLAVPVGIPEASGDAPGVADEPGVAVPSAGVPDISGLAESPGEAELEALAVDLADGEIGDSLRPQAASTRLAGTSIAAASTLASLIGRPMRRLSEAIGILRSLGPGSARRRYGSLESVNTLLRGSAHDGVPRSRS